TDDRARDGLRCVSTDPISLSRNLRSRSKIRCMLHQAALESKGLTSPRSRTSEAKKQKMPRLPRLASRQQMYAGLPAGDVDVAIGARYHPGRMIERPRCALRQPGVPTRLVSEWAPGVPSVSKVLPSNGERLRNRSGAIRLEDDIPTIFRQVRNAPLLQAPRHSPRNGSRCVDLAQQLSRPGLRSFHRAH